MAELETESKPSESTSSAVQEAVFLLTPSDLSKHQEASLRQLLHGNMLPAIEFSVHFHCLHLSAGQKNQEGASLFFLTQNECSHLEQPTQVVQASSSVCACHGLNHTYDDPFSRSEVATQLMLLTSS